VISASLYEWLAHPLVILAVTARLTGLLVPLVKATMDDRKLRNQKRFDAELSRQAKVIDSQAELLSERHRRAQREARPPSLRKSRSASVGAMAAARS
jgi:uncharacterized membrane-anchored protein YhcB (DUF1043 family)